MFPSDKSAVSFDIVKKQYCITRNDIVSPGNVKKQVDQQYCSTWNDIVDLVEICNSGFFLAGAGNLAP